jgi:hypothetical protein
MAGASNASVGPGFALQVSDSGLTNFTSIAEVHAITGPEGKVNMVSVFNQLSPGKADELRPSKITWGDITAEISYVRGDPTHAGLLTLLANGYMRYWKITDPNSAVVWSGRCYVSGFKPEFPEDDRQKATISLSMDGPVTVA